MTNAFARIDPEAVFAATGSRYQFRRRGRDGQLHKVWAVELLEGASLTVAWGEIEGGPGSFLVEFGRGDFCIIPAETMTSGRYEAMDEAASDKLRDIANNFRQVPRKHLQGIARLLPMLMANPHPGLNTWHEACTHVVQMLREAVFYKPAAPTLPVDDQRALVEICQAVTKFGAGQEPGWNQFGWMKLLHQLRAALQ